MSAGDTVATLVKDVQAYSGKGLLMDDSTTGICSEDTARGDSAYNAPCPEVRLVGGPAILHAGMKLLLEGQGAPVVEDCDEVDDLQSALARVPGSPAKVTVLVLAGKGPFRAFHLLRDMLSDLEDPLPLVVVSDKVSRGHVYTALRSGVRAYVSLNADPTDLLTSIRKAADGKVYLSEEAAELVAEDISSSGERPGEGRLPKVELSPREVEIVQLLCEGHISRDIGGQLHISAKTVENHRYNIYRKCGVENIAGLIRHALEHGMIDL
jgi:two-component system response regulator NreC